MKQTTLSLEPAGVRKTRCSKRISVSTLLGCESACYGAPREFGGGPLTENPPVSVYFQRVTTQNCKEEQTPLIGPDVRTEHAPEPVLYAIRKLRS